MSRANQAPEYEGPERRSKNGTHKLIWWIMTVSVGILVAVGTAKSKKVDDLGERVATAEARIQVMDRWLERVEQKLDRALRR